MEVYADRVGDMRREGGFLGRGEVAGEEVAERGNAAGEELEWREVKGE